MNPMLNIAETAARKAGDLIIRAYNQSGDLGVIEKSHNDFVSKVDQQAENTILAIVNKAYPDHAILAEESGSQKGNDYEWIIDPLDGTTNFLHTFPHFAVSIALHYKGKAHIAVIYDPFRQELFSASRGNGAMLNGRRIRVGKAKGIKSALIGTGFPFRRLELLDSYLETFKAIFPDSSGVRRAGSAALDLAYVAAGRLDGFWEFGLSPWDIAAGAMLIRESGGLVGDFDGGEGFLESGNVVAGNPKVFADLISRLRGVSD